MLLDPVWIKLVTPDHQLDVHPTETPKQATTERDNKTQTHNHQLLFIQSSDGG